MKKLFLPLFLLIVFTGKSQTKNFQTEINQQIWMPFIETYNKLDSKGFMDLHTKDLIRVPIDDKSILNFEEYKAGNESTNEYYLKNKRTRKIEFRFKDRIFSEKTAFEIGYYKITTIQDGKTGEFYGKFTVVLRKEEGRWKIALDSDSGEGIDEKVFLSGKLMDEK